MQQDFWHRRWQKNEIGFHQETINRYLQDHWQRISVTSEESVLVPLCGKSQDMWWLAERGHPVLGIELSAIACKDFFEQAGVPAEVHPGEPFTRFQHESVQLWCGDFFALTAEDIQNVQLVYDRAALIAFPPEMRSRYAQHLTDIVRPGARILLVTLEYNAGDLKGPPFPVFGEEVEQLYGRKFHIERLHEQDLARDDPFAKRLGLSAAREVVYCLSKDR